jgi:hypothetical protein
MRVKIEKIAGAKWELQWNLAPLRAAFSHPKAAMDLIMTETLFEISEISASEMEKIQSGNLYIKELTNGCYLSLLQPRKTEKAFQKNKERVSFTSFSLLKSHILTVNKLRKDNQCVRSLSCYMCSILGTGVSGQKMSSTNH